MPRPPVPVRGVYQREDDPSGNWYARFRIDGKLVKKSFGTDRAAAIEYVEKARTLRRVGEGHVPKSAKGVPKTAKELETSTVDSSVLVGELCDDLLLHIQRKPNVYKDQKKLHTELATSRSNSAIVRQPPSGPRRFLIGWTPSEERPRP